MMDLEQVEVLEKKIGQAVRLIEQLKSQNQKMENEIRELKNEAQSKEALIQRLQEDNRNLNEKVDETSLGKEKEEKIKLKVEQMLSKLDELENTQ